MDFLEAERIYHNWCEQFRAGQISAQELTARLDKLRVQDNRGNWWQISHPEGVWLCWDGEQWLPQTPPQSEASAASQPEISQGVPQTLGQLLGLLLRSLLNAIPKQIFTGSLICVVIWLIHTILVVVVNEGFNPSNNQWFNSLLVLSSQIIPGTLFWFFSGILVGQLFRGTLGKYIVALGRLPNLVTGFLQQNLQGGSPVLWLGIASALVFSATCGNLLVSLQITIFTLGALNEPNHFLSLVARLGWSDFQRIFRGGKSRKTLSVETINVLLSGVALGCLVAAVLFLLAKPTLKLAAIIAVAVTVLQIFIGKGSNPGGKALLLLIGLFSILMWQGDCAWADDGGWREAGGRLDLWIQSPGALTAIILGLPAAGGFWLGWIWGGDGTPQGADASASLPDIEYTYPDGRHTTLVYDPQQGGYINILTGGLVEPNEIEAWKQKNIEIHQQVQIWRAHNAELVATGQDAQSQALAAIQANYAERQHLLNRISQMEKNIFEGKMGLGDLMNPGQPGDIMANLSQLREQIASGNPIDRQKLQAVGKLYSDTISGRILTVNQIPQPDNWFDSTIDAVMETTKQLATVRGEDGQFSWLRLAGRIGADVLTGGYAEVVFVPTEAILKTKEYVDEGGDDLLEGSRRAMENAAINLYMGEIFSRMFKAASGMGKGIQEGDSIAQVAGKTTNRPGQAVSSLDDAACKPTINSIKSSNDILSPEIKSPKQVEKVGEIKPHTPPAKLPESAVKTISREGKAPPPSQGKNVSPVPSYQIRQGVVNKVLNETENLNPQERLEVASNLKKANKITDAEYNAIRDKVKPKWEGRPVEGQGGHDDVSMTSMEELSRKEQLNVCQYRPDGNHAEINLNEAGAWDKLGKKDTLFTYPKNKPPSDLTPQDITIYSANDEILPAQQIAAMKNKILSDIRTGGIS